MAQLVKGWTTVSLIERDDIPVFTYVADGLGTCANCHMAYHAGATVVRIGVAYNESGGWKTYHMDCYAPSTPCT